MTHSTDDIFSEWLAATEARHLKDLRVPEVTRALRALSSAYVERRHRVASHATLDTAGKRAAFALFYAPLHFLTVRSILHAIDVAAGSPVSVIDLGCGTGAAGAAWALSVPGTASVLGIDRHPWAVEESRWTYRVCHLPGTARQGDVTRLPRVKPKTAIVAAYVLNELPDAPRLELEHTLLRAARDGARVLVIEPIARGITPWWAGAAARVEAAGGRADEWRFDVELPPVVQLFDRAAGLRHDVITARSLFLPGA